jgi:hypothetical protein
MREILGMSNAHLCLVAQAVAAINPDVFGQNLALLVQFHVFGQLITKLDRRRMEDAGEAQDAKWTHVGSIGNVDGFADASLGKWSA